MERFWKKVQKTDTCWLWTAGSRGNGYGCIKYKGKVHDAHRFVWFLTHGSFSKKWILHKCNNRKCVNPEHLYEGTPKQNFDDMERAGTRFVQKSKYASPADRRRKTWMRWYEKAKNEPGRERYNRWRKTQKSKKDN